ncbi:hypothetical protein DSECCO2_553840 [anaerobic digester metagenome]
MLTKGFLATTSFYPSYAHKQQHIKKYICAIDQTFKIIKQSLKEGNPKTYLKGPECQSGFKRLT